MFRIRIVVAVALAAALLSVGFSRPAAAQDGDGRQWLSQPATREFVAQTIVERALHIPAEELRRDGRAECFGDAADFTSVKRARQACYLSLLGFMGDTGRFAEYPTFEPRKAVRRDQMASLVWRLATNGEDRPPAHAAVFIDVSRRNVHEPAIRWGALHGIINGYDTTPAEFRPAQSVTRRQVIQLVKRTTAHWANQTIR